MLIREKISKEKFAEMTKDIDMLKVAVDIERGILSAGCELHSDCAEELLRDGSAVKDIWGANVHANYGNIDFVSLINIRPADDNRSMKIQRQDIKENVEKVVKKLVPL